MTGKKQTTMGTIPLLLLKLLAQEDMYGYQIIEELYLRSNHTFALKAGSLYPVLHTLEQQGLVSSYNGDTAGGRVRKYYHLTDAGRRELTRKAEQWHAYVGAVNSVLEGGPCDATS